MTARRPPPPPRRSLADAQRKAAHEVTMFCIGRDEAAHVTYSDGVYHVEPRPEAEARMLNGAQLVGVYEGRDATELQLAVLSDCQALMLELESAIPTWNERMRGCKRY